MMSSDNLSQTSDYSSSSDRSGLVDYIGHDRSGASNSQYRTQYKPFTNLDSINPNFSNYQSSSSSDQGMTEYMRLLVSENRALKEHTKKLQLKAKQIDEYETQLHQLQSEYENFAQSTAKREELEVMLRNRLDLELRKAKQNVSKATIGVQTDVISNSMDNPTVNQSDKLINEHETKNGKLIEAQKQITELKLQLQEKDELILTLVSTSNHVGDMEYMEDDLSDTEFAISNVTAI